MVNTAIIALLVLVVIGIFMFFLLEASIGVQNINGNQFGNPSSINYPTTTPTTSVIPQSQLDAYALSLINKDRGDFNLSNVSYSNVTSAQQHADSMLKYGYFSHWDIYDMKPYMRYTLLGGKGSVDENIAYVYDSAGINVLDSLKNMEYNMMYNDSICCNNGHRYNILTPIHNQVSIGIAYNSTTIYFVEDFINNYITWFYGTPSYSGGTVNLQGAAQNGYTLSLIDIIYDSPLVNTSPSQLPRSPYSYGSTVACIGHRQGFTYYSCSGVQTLNATTYNVQGNDFNVSFDMGNLVSQYGPGEYTLSVCLANTSAGQQSVCSSSSSTDFVASTYTIFINQNGQQYVPADV